MAARCSRSAGAHGPVAGSLMRDATGIATTIIGSVRSGAAIHAGCFANPRESVQSSQSFLPGRCVRRTSDRQRRAVRSQCLDGGIENFAARFLSDGDQPLDGPFGESSHQRSRPQCSRQESRFVEARGGRDRHNQEGSSGSHRQARRFEARERRSSQVCGAFVPDCTSEFVTLTIA